MFDMNGSNFLSTFVLPIYFSSDDLILHYRQQILSSNFLFLSHYQQAILIGIPAREHKMHEGTTHLEICMVWREKRRHPMSSFRSTNKISPYRYSNKRNVFGWLFCPWNKWPIKIYVVSITDISCNKYNAGVSF